METIKKKNDIINIFNKNKSLDLNGVSFHGDTIYTTKNELISVFGNDYEKEDDLESKVSVLFELSLNDGTVFIIYDYKNYGNNPFKNGDKKFTFNIGTHTKEESKKVYDKLVELGFKSKEETI